MTAAELGDLLVSPHADSIVADGITSVIVDLHGDTTDDLASIDPRATAGSLPIVVNSNAASLTLSPGERVILYSDGAVEERNGRGEFFGLERLVAALATTESTKTDVAAVFETIRHFTGVTTLDDDVTIASIACED